MVDDEPVRASDGDGAGDRRRRRRCATASARSCRSGVDVSVGAVESRLLPARPAESYRGDIEQAVGDVQQWLKEGYRVVVVHPGHGPAQRMVEVLARARRPGPAGRRPRRRRPAAPTWSPSPAARLTHGFVDETNRVVLLTGEDLSGQKASTRDMRADAGPPQAPDRPARAGGRRLRRARAARRRPVRRDEAARGRRRGPRVPRPRVRRVQARRPARPALRPGRRARPGDPLRRRRAADASTGSAAPTGPSARAGPARRCARSRPS